jgi:hypothetical protein
MRWKRSEGESSPATLGGTAKARLLLRVWCTACRHEVDIDLLSWRSATVATCRGRNGRRSSSIQGAAGGVLLSSSRQSHGGLADH